MNKKNFIAALFSLAALIGLFFKLAAVRDFFGFATCLSCTRETPFLTLLAAAYFAFFTVILLCFDDFAGKFGAKLGLLWSIGLALILSFLRSDMCLICLGAHACHIGAWIVLMTKQENRDFDKSFMGLKLACACTCAISVAALYSTLNFTFALYGLQFQKNVSSLIQAGQKIPSLALTTKSGDVIEHTAHKALVIDFVSSHCPYCKEQLAKLNNLAASYKEKGFRFVAVYADDANGDAIRTLEELAPNLDWIKDFEGILFTSFGISGFPTMVVLNSDAVVTTTVTGIPTDYEKMLQRELDALVL